MDQVTDLERWKAILITLEWAEAEVSVEALTEMKNLFDHLSSQTVPRLQKEYQACVLRSIHLFKELFDRIECSDQSILCCYLRLLRSFGYFRMAQISYHIDGPRDECDIDPIYFPPVKTSKFYDLRPLLPKAGTIGWKAIMNHCLVKDADNRQLLQECLQLLTQKLKFYSIISLIDRFQDSSEVIRLNGERVATKLYELIRDVACDDECMVGLDASLFTLLDMFMNDDQRADIINATVQDLFKPCLIEVQYQDEKITKIYELISDCIMVNMKLQDVLVKKLLEHAASNVIRHKKRRIRDSDAVGDNLQDLLLKISEGDKIDDVLRQVNDVESAGKRLQLDYISHWMAVIHQILPQRTLTASNSAKIVGFCSVLLASSANALDQDLIRELSTLLTRMIESTGQTRLDKFFNACSPTFLSELTNYLIQNTKLLSTFDAPIQQFYKSYLSRYLRFNMMRGSKHGFKLFESFVEFICSKKLENLNEDALHLLHYVCIHELAECLHSSNKVSIKMLEIPLDCARLCSENLHEFVQHNSHLGVGIDGEVDEDCTTMDVDDTPEEGSNKRRLVAVDILVCIVRIAIDRNERKMLDCYSDLLLKLTNAITSRVGILIGATRVGDLIEADPLDPHIAKLLNLYIEHNDLIKSYLNYDLIEKISSLLVIAENDSLTNGTSAESKKAAKKKIYNEIKAKLSNLEKRVNSSSEVYQTIINKQYGFVVDQSLSSVGDIKKEKECCHLYMHQMKTMKEVSTIILSNCDLDTYNKVLSKTVHCLENCDPLDHGKVLFYFLMLESLIPIHNPQLKESATSNSFKDLLPRISCSLIRITKSVELGPSIHAFKCAGTHKSNGSIRCCTYTKAIKIYTLIFLRYPSKITNALITDAMQICTSSNLFQYAKYSVRMSMFFLQLGSATAGLLKSICMGKKEEETLRSSMPIFLSVFSHLIRCLILASDRQKLNQLPANQMNGHDKVSDSARASDVCKNFETQLELLALDVGRTLNNLSSLRVKLVDYAPHLISAYIKDVQRASCPDSITLHLNEGLFRIFNLVDAHQKERQEHVIENNVQRKTTAGRASGSLFEMIHARLDQASREIFRDMHDNYNKFHRYLGKC